MTSEQIILDWDDDLVLVNKAPEETKPEITTKISALQTAMGIARIYSIFYVWVLWIKLEIKLKKWSASSFKNTIYICLFFKQTVKVC